MPNTSTVRFSPPTIVNGQSFGPDMPTCPACKAHNGPVVRWSSGLFVAMLGHRAADSAEGAFDGMKCRDCGHEALLVD